MSQNTEHNVRTQEELLPCPRCGEEASFGLVRYRKTNRPSAWFGDGTPVEIAHYVNCAFCSLKNQTIVGGFQTRELAAQHWNSRPAIERAIAEAVAAERERGVSACRKIEAEYIGARMGDCATASHRCAEAIRSAAK